MNPVGSTKSDLFDSQRPDLLHIDPAIPIARVVPCGVCVSKGDVEKNQTPFWIQHHVVDCLCFHLPLLQTLEKNSLRGHSWDNDPSGLCWLYKHTTVFSPSYYEKVWILEWFMVHRKPFVTCDTRIVDTENVNHFSRRLWKQEKEGGPEFHPSLIGKQVSSSRTKLTLLKAS